MGYYIILFYNKYSKLTFPIVFPKYVFNRLRHENIVSGVAVDTGSVQNICNKTNKLGLHNMIASIPVFRDFFPKRKSFVCNKLNSAFTV